MTLTCLQATERTGWDNRAVSVSSNDSDRVQVFVLVILPVVVIRTVHKYRVMSSLEFSLDNCRQVKELNQGKGVCPFCTNKLLLTTVSNSSVRNLTPSTGRTCN